MKYHLGEEKEFYFGGKYHTVHQIIPGKDCEYTEDGGQKVKIIYHKPEVAGQLDTREFPKDESGVNSATNIEEDLKKYNIVNDVEEQIFCS